MEDEQSKSVNLSTELEKLEAKMSGLDIELELSKIEVDNVRSERDLLKKENYKLKRIIENSKAKVL